MSSSPLVLGIVIPKLFLHELVELGLDLNHDMHLLFLEFEGSVQLLWVKWECETVLEVDVVEPLLHVVLEEAE